MYIELELTCESNCMSLCNLLKNMTICQAVEQKSLSCKIAIFLKMKYHEWKKYHECSHSNFFDMIHIINAISNTQFAVKVHISFACLKMCLFWQRCVTLGIDNFLIKGLVKDLLHQSLVTFND